jgi:hypothetical protein
VHLRRTIGKTHFVCNIFFRAFTPERFAQKNSQYPPTAKAEEENATIIDR